MIDLEIDAARAELERLPLDPEFLSALEDPSHPGHKSATARRRHLYAAAYREERSGESGTEVADPESSNEGNHRSENSHAFFGPPVDPTDYRFDPAPHGLVYDVELEHKARGWFHQTGLPQWLARNVVREWNRTIEKQPDPQQIESAAASTERSLRRTWGDHYDDRIKAARSVVRSLNSDEVVELLNRSGLANNEYLIRQLVALTESRQGS